MELRPELLQHPNIPKPLHGVNPRTILGDSWWNQVRQAAYAANDYHCWACGVHKNEAKYHHWLEAHETYNIDYSTGKVEMTGIVSLCHACHNFIHSGRLLMLWRQGEIDTQRAKEILIHGFRILRDARLKAFFQAYETWAEIVLHLPDPRGYAIEKQAVFPPPTNEEKVSWGDWRLVIGGVEYPPLYASYMDWEMHYFGADGKPDSRREEYAPVHKSYEDWKEYYIPHLSDKEKS